MITPAYLETYERDRMREKVARAIEELRDCTACPRDCHVNRLENRTAVCRTGRLAQVASCFPHFGEEDCLRGTRGSGTIFFSFCNLKCVFCQNFDISWQGHGRATEPRDLARMMIRLQAHGCHNINFVTPEHVVPQIVEALPHAIEMGLRLPLVYNTSAYDALSSVALMDGLIDIYMPDFKFWDAATAKRLVIAGDYPERARAAIREMHRQVGPLQLDEGGLARRGVLVRHLVMPNGLASTAQVMRWLADEISRDTYVNLMDQYHPAGKVGRDPKYEDIDRAVTRQEMRDAYAAARAAGLHRFDARRECVPSW